MAPTASQCQSSSGPLTASSGRHPRFTVWGLRFGVSGFGTPHQEVSGEPSHTPSRARGVSVHASGWASASKIPPQLTNHPRLNFQGSILQKPWPWPFWLKTAIASALSARSLLFPSETAQDATQGMEYCSSSGPLVEGLDHPQRSGPEVSIPRSPKGEWRDSQPARNQQQARRRAPVDPDTAMANALARMSKLEAAMSAVGEEDPIYPGLLEAFKKARAQTQAKPVQDRIAGTELFLKRARKRVEGCRQDVEKATAFGPDRLWPGAFDSGPFDLGQFTLPSSLVCKHSSCKSGAPKGGGPKISLFFPSPATIFFFLLSLAGPFVEFWWCLKRQGLAILA